MPAEESPLKLMGVPFSARSPQTSPMQKQKIAAKSRRIRRLPPVFRWGFRFSEMDEPVGACFLQECSETLLPTMSDLDVAKGLT